MMRSNQESDREHPQNVAEDRLGHGWHRCILEVQLIALVAGIVFGPRGKSPGRQRVLATMLDRSGDVVTIIDVAQAAFSRLPESFKGSTILGSGTDLDVLRQAGAAFLPVRGRDAIRAPRKDRQNRCQIRWSDEDRPPGRRSCVRPAADRRWCARQRSCARHGQCPSAG